MKKFAALFATVISMSVASVGTAFAQSAPLCPASFSSLCALNVSSSGGIVGTVITVLLIIAIIASLFFLIYGGIRYITSGGDKGRIDQARGTIIASIVGLLISLLAFFILNLVLLFVTGKGLSAMSIPTLLQ